MKGRSAGKLKLGEATLTTVTRKGRITIPANMRSKYGIREGMKMEVVDASTGILLRPIPAFVDLAGVDAGKYTYSEMAERLDRLRQRRR